MMEWGKLFGGLVGPTTAGVKQQQEQHHENQRNQNSRNDRVNRGGGQSNQNRQQPTRSQPTSQKPSSSRSATTHKSQGKQDAVETDPAAAHEELSDLIEKKNRGDDIDEDRLAFLKLLCHRQNNANKDGTINTGANVENKSIDSDNTDVSIGKVSSKRVSRGPSILLRNSIQQEDLGALYDSMKRKGMSPYISQSSSYLNDVSQMSFHGDDSYLGDLLGQKLRLEKEHKEYVLEEAFELYEKMLKETNLPRNEELFYTIFQQVKAKTEPELVEKARDLEKHITQVLQQQEKRRDQESSPSNSSTSFNFNNNKISYSRDSIEEEEPIVEDEDGPSVTNETNTNEEDELMVLLEKKYAGVSYDQDRLEYLELLARERRGEFLTEDEMKKIHTSESDNKRKTKEEEQSVEQQQQQQQKQQISDDEMKELEKKFEIQDEDELMKLLEKKYAGEDYDHDRLYNLELIARERRGEFLTDDEGKDLSLFKANRLLGMT